MDRKERLRQYKETPRPVGVYLVRNTASGTAFIGSSVNIAGMLNRLRFQLEMGGHPNRELQAQWDEFGADAFVFETLDTLEPPTDPDYDPTEDLATLEDMWLDRLSTPEGADGADAGDAPSVHPLAPHGVTRISTRTPKPSPC